MQKYLKKGIIWRCIVRVANMAYSLSRDLVEARTCYKHLAGELGMSIISALIVCGYIIAHGEDDNTRYALSVHGKYWSQRLGIPSLNRTKISACMDYSHQGHHISGLWAIDLCAFLFNQRYIKRGVQNRSIVVTPKGRHFLRDELAVEWNK